MGACAGVGQVLVRSAARIPVRPVRLIAEGFGFSRARVERLLAEGNLVSTVHLSNAASTVSSSVAAWQRCDKLAIAYQAALHFAPVLIRARADRRDRTL
ncbi:DUF1062 domain-containing protein [Streptomyces sp. NPDC058620]|uniref:DUF1062 domain-containing protein n=1 Tax=Streptomyces sp. NPDC058620 TaxID=3346560 RepID=UPI00364BB983